MSSRRQILLARVNWYLQTSLKHVTGKITGNIFYYRGGPYRQVSLYDIAGVVQDRCNSSAWAMELHLSCTNPAIYDNHKKLRKTIRYFMACTLQNNYVSWNHQLDRSKGSTYLHCSPNHIQRKIQRIPLFLCQGLVLVAVNFADILQGYFIGAVNQCSSSDENW